MTGACLEECFFRFHFVVVPLCLCVVVAARFCCSPDCEEDYWEDERELRCQFIELGPTLCFSHATVNSSYVGHAKAGDRSHREGKRATNPAA